MANLAENTNPAEQSLEDQRAAEALDEKLRASAARSAAIRAERAARGQPSTVAESVARQTSEWRDRLAAASAQNPANAERLLRLAPEEGDQPEIPDSFRRGMVPARFSDVTFANYDPANRSQSAALKAAQFWTERALKGEGCMLALIGPQGTGKSHLLYAAANALLDGGQRLYARPWYRLADELRYGGEHPVTRREIDAPEVRTTLWRQKIVLLDEVRQTAGTAFDDMELTKFSCHCYDARYPMFITSNVNPLSDVMGGPAASRFTLVTLDGPDRRQA